jgi:ketosteroid isomerase-like protein
MADSQAVAIAQEVWTKMGAGDWDGVRALLADDFVQEWPQSRERIEGPDDAIAINRNFPGGMPMMTFRRTTGSGDMAVLEAELRYPDGSVYQGVSVIEVRDGKVVREVDYFAQPFEAPQWRAQWVKRTPA